MRAIHVIQQLKRQEPNGEGPTNVVNAEVSANENIC